MVEKSIDKKLSWGERNPEVFFGIMSFLAGASLTAAYFIECV